MSLVSWTATFTTNGYTPLKNADVSVYKAGTSISARIFDANGKLYDTAPQAKTGSTGQVTIYLDTDDYFSSQLFDVKVETHPECGETGETIELKSIMLLDDSTNNRYFAAEPNADHTASHTSNNTENVSTVPSTHIAGWAYSTDTTKMDGGSLQDATVVGSKLASATITGDKLANATITATQIANATITGDKISSATITGSNIATATIEAGNIADATITGSKIASATITAGNIADSTITGGKIATGTITGGLIASGAITTGHIGDLAITAAKIDDLTITAGKIADSTITGGKVAASTIGKDKLSFTAFDFGTDTLDDIGDGTNYAKVLKTDISAGHILLSACTGDLDDIGDGTNYGRVLLTDISSGHIKLSECIGSIDDVVDGTTYGRVAITDISSGHIKISETIGVSNIQGSNLFLNGDAELGDNTNFSNLTYESTGAYAGKGCYSKTGAGWYKGDNRVDIDTSATYQIQVAVKTDATAKTVYTGLACYTEDDKEIKFYNCWHGSGRDTTLYAAASTSDTSVQIVPPSTDWYDPSASPWSYIQFDTQTDGSDLPNFTAKKIASIDKTNDPTYWIVNLDSVTVGADYASGTGVSNVTAGGTYLYTPISGETISNTDWVLHSAYITDVNGVNEAPNDFSKFRIGTKYVKFIFDADYNNDGGTLYFDSIGLFKMPFNLDGIPDGSTWGKVASTSIDAGKIILTSGTGVTGTLPATNTEADVTADQFTNALSTIDGSTDKVELGLDTNGNLVTKVLPGSNIGTPGGAGLFLGADYLGYYSGSAWQVFIDNTGKFTFEGDANNKISWDGTSLSVVGNITVKNPAGVRSDINVADGADVTKDKIESLLGPNFLVNGSFEAGLNVGFIANNASISTSEYHSGTQCLKQAENSGGPESFFNAIIPAQQGNIFYCSGWFKRDESTIPSYNAVFQIREYDSDGIQLVVAEALAASPSVSGWQHKEGIYTVSDASCDHIKVACATNEGDGTTFWYFDDFYIAKATSELGADVTKTVIDAGLITTGGLRSNNWATSVGTNLDLNSETLKFGGSQVDAAGDYAGVFLGKDSDSKYKFFAGDTLEFLKFDGISTTAQFRRLDLSKEATPGACSAALAGNGAGNLSNGDYYYKVTFVTDLGETIPGTASNKVTVSDNSSDGQVDLTNIPTGSNRVTARKIYRTKVNEIYDYYYLATISDNITATYTDNIADSSLGDEAPNRDTSGNVIYAYGNPAMRICEGNTCLGQHTGLGYSTTVNIGYYAGNSMTTGAAYVNIGDYAGQNITTASFGVNIGYYTGQAIITGSNNTNVGCSAGKSINTGESNTCIGKEAGDLITSGNRNVCIGWSSATQVSTGSYNTMVGCSTGGTLQTGDNNTCLGYSAGISGTDLSNAMALGYATYVDASNKVVIGNSSVTTIGGYANWTNYSDARLKENIESYTIGLDFIKELNPIAFDYKPQTKVIPERKDPETGEIIEPARTEIFTHDRKETGLTAQDVKAAMDKLGIKHFSGYHGPTNDKEMAGVAYGAFVIPLINAVKELDKRLEVLENAKAVK